MMQWDNLMKKIDINVILTFCSYNEYGSQEIFDVSLNYNKNDKSAKALLEHSGFFDTIVQVCVDCERLPSELVKISTAANWTKNGFAFDIGDGKWSFGSWRGQNIAWSDNLAKPYGFGKDDNTADCDLNLLALHGVMSSRTAMEVINKARGK